MDAAPLLDVLAARGQTLGTAESLTGGRLAALLTAVPGASRVYVGGVVTYATELKQSLLGVPDAVVVRCGVVSAECAAAMALGVRERLGADWGLATTGVAGPDRQEDKPPGTVFVGIAGPGVGTTVALELAGDREAIQDRTCREAITALTGMLTGILRGEEPGLR